jgi:plastocyanin
MGFAAGLATVAAALGLAACGGGGGGAATCTPGQSASMTIKSTGISPTNVCVLPAGSVTFTNSDAVPHHIEFDAATCPTVPEIAAGSSQQATFPSTVMNCSFHDGNNPAAAFSGTVAVTSAVVSGGGY